jgi:uncharacterized membrane protein
LAEGIVMDPIIADWISLALRWAHVMVGIMWIGTSFHFIWLDASLRREPGMGEGLAGATWMVHGGGFYRAAKYMVAPPEMPSDLHWFKYEAYFTWITGFLLLAVVYYLGVNDLLIDPRVMELTPLKAIGISVASLVAGWIIYDLLCRSPIGDHTGLLAFLVFLLACAAAYGFTHVFSGRAAFVHVGAFLGTIMAANVFVIIIPNQKKVVAALIAGKAPDPALGKSAKQRSLHNNYLTLPVVLMMISNHYPMMFEHAQSWLIVVGILLFSGLLRLYANMKNAGASGSPVTAILFYAALVGMGAVAYASYRPGADLAAIGPVTFADVQAIVAHRCQACHSANPIDTAYKVAPKGIAFDTPDQIQRMAPQIERMVVLTQAMPIGNKTGMLPEERLVIAKWLADSKAAVE